MRKILAIFALLLLADSAWADPIPKAPGWSLDQIEQEEEGSYGDGASYFSLKPPDHRPAITIDYSTAKKLRTSEAKPEEVYGGAASGDEDAPSKKKGMDLASGPGGKKGGAGKGKNEDNSAPSQGGDITLARPPEQQEQRRPASVDVPPANMNPEQQAAYSQFMQWRASKSKELPRPEMPPIDPQQ